MAIDYYRNLTPVERLDKVGELLVKGIYLYHQNKNSETKEPLDKKGKVSISKSRRRRDVNFAPPVNLDERILTIKEAIDFLKISRTTFWRLRKQGNLPYHAFSNKLIRFKVSEILNFVNSKKVC